MITLRPKQVAVIEESRAKLRDGTKRLMIQAPCGFGKTVLGSFIVMNAASKGRRIYFMVHRDELAKQASRTFTNFGIDHGFIMAAFTPSPRKLVQIAMIDTLRNRYERLPVPDILLVDEAHHAASASWQKIINYYAERGTVIIGLSATPSRLDGKPLNDIFDDMVLGPTVKSLIDDGALSKYRYYAPPQVVDLNGVGSKFGDFDKKALAERSDKPQVVGDALAHYKKLLSGKRAIVFAVSIAASQHVVEQFIAGGVPAAHVDGEMSREERAKAISAFERGDILVLSNVSLFGEGFDVKACEGVILLRATQSLSLHIQMCGRAMRPHESKEEAIIIDHVGNVGRLGMPDDEHEWSLEGSTKKGKRKKKDDEPTIPVAQCVKCYACFKPAPVCPHCGEPVEVKTRKVEHVDGELHEITREMAEAMRKDKRREVGQAQSLAELQKIAAERGYSSGWAYHTWQAKSRKRAPQRPPEPSLDDLRQMTLPELENVANAQGWPMQWASTFYHQNRGAAA